ncbi:MAG: hypothetical protein LBT40_02405 [Deltaproteobacteria bacterium]|nr:hypothetical protein [Deltaproteobacteria bacterium]
MKAAEDFLATVKKAQLPTRIFSLLFHIDGRAFSGWKLRGVPPELLRPVEEVTKNLKALLRARMLPVDMNELAYLGLETLSERLADDERDGNVPGKGAPRPA